MCGSEPSVCGNCGKAFVCYTRGGGEMKTSAVNQTCSHLKYTHQAAWSFVVMPVHGGESTLEGKDCAHAHDTNSAFNVISDSGMHACITKTGL